VTTPVWLAGAAGHGSIVHVPDGPAWAAILRLVHRNIGSFTQQEHPLLLGLIEDACRNVSWWAPELDGAEFVAGIGHWLLAGFDDYSSEGPRKRVLRVIAKIPNGDAARFEAVLRGTVKEDQRRDRIADDFRDIIFSGLDGMPAARDLPDLVVSVAADYLLASDEDLQKDRYSRSSLDLETHFGIQEGLRHDFFPASALRGPWISLLRYHPRKALDFLIKVFNQSADWYAHPRVHDPLEPAWEIELTFADGTTRKQWGNPRLWNLYRGTSVGPYVLQSLLMALEKWLLDFASAYPEQLDAVLVEILRRSESAALASVVASLATAYPHASGEALLVLLSAPDCIVFDRDRMAGERQTSTLLGIFPQIRADNKIYEEERKEADRLPHRREDLEAAIINVQLGPLAPRVHAILDRHRAAFPPLSDQNDSHRVWRLALHRMDLRRYTVAESSDVELPGTETKPNETGERYIRLEPKAPDPDVQAMVDENATRFGAMTARMGLMMWAYKIFKREQCESHDPSMWEERLLEAMSANADDEDDAHMVRGGPGIVAAVCIRDHWEEMSTPQRDWCLERACSEVMTQANEWSHLDRVQRYDMAADRASAWVLPLLLTKPISETQRSTIMKAFVAALTHPIDEVRWYVVWGVTENTWPADRLLAMRCVNAIAMEAQLIEVERRAQDKTPYNQRRKIDEIIEEAAAAVRHAFSEPDGIAPNAYDVLDVSEGCGADANARILTILSNGADDAAAIAAFVRAAKTLVDWWDADDDRNRGQRRRERNHDSETALSQRLQSFVMRTSAELAKSILEPILRAINRHPREVHWIIQGLTGIEDSTPNTRHFWYLWGLFADGVKRARWVSRLNDEHPFVSEMLSAIFLTSWWKDNVRHWRSLEGYAHHVHALFEALPASSIVLDDYMRFLYHIGERSLPEAFVRVANSLKRGDAQAMLAGTNAVFLLEVLLQRHVYGRPLELKRDPAVRQAVLFLLDTLVENGSSAAFGMRDDFVTPTPQH
jgi:hypothetical protein